MNRSIVGLRAVARLGLVMILAAIAVSYAALKKAPEFYD
jgi:hypothetical protein